MFSSPPSARRAEPAVVVHGLAQLRLALRPGLPVTLLSAPAAACFAGSAWWRALMAIGRAEFGGPWDDILDCGDAPGTAMAALRLGQRRLILAEAAPGFAAVVAAASALGAEVTTARPPLLDLARPGAGRRLLLWLQGDSGQRLG